MGPHPREVICRGGYGAVVALTVIETGDSSVPLSELIVL